jgi:hypothetical protein
VPEVESVAGADVDHPPAQARQQLLAVLGMAGLLGPSGDTRYARTADGAPILRSSSREGALEPPEPLFDLLGRDRERRQQPHRVRARRVHHEPLLE